MPHRREDVRPQLEVRPAEVAVQRGWRPVSGEFTFDVIEFATGKNIVISLSQRQLFGCQGEDSGAGRARHSPAGVGSGLCSRGKEKTARDDKVLRDYNIQGASIVYIVF